MRSRCYVKKTAATLAVVCCLFLCAGSESFAALSPSDYSNSGNWMSVPENADKSIDVFFLYPSAWDGSGGGTYADIDNPQMRERAREILAKTTGMFDHVANIYAPYYRQSNAADTLGKSLAEVEKGRAWMPWRPLNITWQTTTRADPSFW